jgi:hypothetical protein
MRFLEWGDDSCKHIGCGVCSTASHMDTRGSYLGVKWITLPPSNALVKNAWIYTTGAPYVFVVCCLFECSDVGLLRAGALTLLVAYFIFQREKNMTSLCPHISPYSLCAPTYHHALCVPPDVTILSLCAPTYHRGVPPRITTLCVLPHHHALCLPPTYHHALCVPPISPCSLSLSPF